MLAALTPYPIPPSLQGRKVCNVGDGFILRAIERRVGPFAADRTLSPRVALTDAEVTRLRTCDAVILAGANQLRDTYTVWPGLTADRLEGMQLRLVPFGIGYHGEPGFNDGMSEEARDILRVMHRRIDYSSWRCPVTVRYLRAHLPELSEQFLMTGCPVTYDAPLLDGAAFSRASGKVAVTPTERGDFWERETTIIDFVAKEFPRSERVLVLHQDLSPRRPREALGRLFPAGLLGLNGQERLRRHAVDRGFRIAVPRSADEAMKLYESVDLHIGTRLHAHLLCISRARRSFLVPVDGRATGMAEFLQFPMPAAGQLGDVLDFDFEIVRARARETFVTMQKFLGSLKKWAV